MKAAVLYGEGDLRVEDVPDPGAPDPGMVRVRVQSVGVCGSDVHYFAHGRIGEFVVRDPMILGHEAAGVVEAVGAGVAHLRVGDVVAMEPGVPCGVCRACKSGRYNLCADVQFFATPPVHGALVGAVLHPASFTFRVPDGMTPDMACLAEPVSVAIQAVRKAELCMGERVLVIGAGPIGMLTALVAEFAGATPALVDVSEERLDAARGFGFEAMKPATVNALYDIVFECSGAKGTVLQACRACQAGGTVVLVGMHQSEVADLPTFETLTRELQICGVFRYANTYPAALDFLHKSRERLEPFFRSFVSLDAVAAHFSAAAAGRASALKTIVRM